MFWHKFTHGIGLPLALVAAIMLSAALLGLWLTTVWSPL